MKLSKSIIFFALSILFTRTPASDSSSIFYKDALILKEAPLVAYYATAAYLLNQASNKLEGDPVVAAILNDVILKPGITEFISDMARETYQRFAPLALPADNLFKLNEKLFIIFFKALKLAQKYPEFIKNFPTLPTKTKATLLALGTIEWATILGSSKIVESLSDRIFKNSKVGSKALQAVSNYFIANFVKSMFFTLSSLAYLFTSDKDEATDKEVSDMTEFINDSAGLLEKIYSANKLVIWKNAQ